MLGRLYALLITLIIVCSSAKASQEDWMWHLGRAYFGTNPQSSDTFDSRDVRITENWSTYVGTYHEQGVNGWTGDTGFYYVDVKAPIPVAFGSSSTWAFYLWQNPASNIVLELMWGWNQSAAPAFDKIEYRLTYVRAAQETDGGSVPVGMSIVLNENQQGTWAFPVYKTYDGRTGYMFELTATVIPEPSSLLALGAGGLGLLGAALRRRDRRSPS